MWLRDALPNDVVDEGGNRIARVMLYGHESSLPHSNSFQSLEDLGTSFYSSLQVLGSTASLRPIILIAHSLGGLIAKQVLGPLKSPAVQNTYGIAGPCIVIKVRN